jgi:hypothetical protein
MQGVLPPIVELALVPIAASLCRGRTLSRLTRSLGRHGA